MKYKYGTWSKKPIITHNWTRTDWFINNRELYYTKTQILPLKNITSQKNITIILTLYAICDLASTSNKDYFNLSEIKKMIELSLSKYKIKLKGKGLSILERVCKAKARRCANNIYDTKQDLENQSQEFMKRIDKLYTSKKDKIDNGYNVRMDDIYYAVQCLRGVFLNFKVYSKGKDYHEYQFENDYPASRILWHLNEDGKELLKKYKQNYLF